MRFFFALLSLALVASSTPVWASGDTDLDIGGQVRFRPEMKNNYNFDNDTNADSRYTGQRIRLNIKGTNESVTSFVQIQDSRNWGSSSNVGTATEGGSIADAATTGVAGETHGHSFSESGNSLDLYQAWFQINDLAGAPVTLKMGRQTLVYGSQRLLGHLGWKDNARTFDGIKLSVKAGPGKIDILSVKLNEDGYAQGAELGAADSGTFSSDQNLNGVYGMFNVAEQKIDVYYLINSTGEFFAVNTMGARVAGKTADIDYTAEYVMQGGTVAEDVTKASSALAIEAGYNMGPTRIGFLYAMGSGDDGSDATTDETFVFPFHTNHAHYGHMDFFSWGNMNDIALRFKTKVMEKNVIKVDYHMLSLAVAEDDWLNVVGNGAIFAGASTYEETAAGSELDITFVHPYSANMKIVAGYSMFTPGAAVEERNADKADGASWGYVMMINNF